MTNIYLSTFITGFKDVIRDNLSKAIDISKIDLLWGGLIIYRTKADTNKIKKINYLNNSFVLLKRFDNVDRDSINGMIRQILSDDQINRTVAHYVRQRKFFRVVVSQENRTISVDKNILYKLERKISRNKNLRPYQAKPDIEF